MQIRIRIFIQSGSGSGSPTLLHSLLCQGAGGEHYPGQPGGDLPAGPAARHHLHPPHPRPQRARARDPLRPAPHPHHPGGGGGPGPARPPRRYAHLSLLHSGELAAAAAAAGEGGGEVQALLSEGKCTLE
jgi:hypothetical protein